MKLIVCLDDKNGMMFNNRRQSRDKILIENMLELCKDKKLYTSEYSSKLFPENSIQLKSLKILKMWKKDIALQRILL